MTSRTPEGDSLTASLHFTLALAAQTTAYEAWTPDEPFEDYLKLVKYCLHQARPDGTNSLT
jgi:hypothetical protein